MFNQPTAKIWPITIIVKITLRMIGGIAGTLSLRGDVPRRAMVALVNKITLSTEINVALGL